jgi:glycosyltransferase involved in cell wall biosynthesis
VVWHASVVPAYRGLLDSLAKVSGAEVHLIAPPYWPEQVGHFVPMQVEPEQPYRTHILHGWFIGRHYLYLLKGLSAALRAIRPDIVYCYSGPYWVISYQALRACRRYLPNARLAFVSDQNLYKTYPLPFSAFERALLEHADFATGCCSEAVDRLVEKGFPKARAARVPLGFDPAIFNGSNGTERRPGSIIYVGRLLPMKGVQNLLRACARLRVPYSLDICGDGCERDSLAAEARDLRVPAHFLGPQPPEKVAELMRASQLLVLPSHTVPGRWKEQFGRVLIEAMACGCVPVGSDSGAIPEVVGDAGVVFRERDVKGLAEAVSQLLSDPAMLLRFRSRGIGHARKYTWDAVAEDLWTVMSRAATIPKRQ